MATEVTALAVLGAGTMGRGIAQVCASSGIQVKLYDVESKQLERALDDIKSGLQKLVAKNKLSASEQEATLGRIQITSDLAKACASIDLVIEAAPESMDLKVSLLAEIRRAAPATTLIGSNTSSLSVTELGQRV